jgi:hypothetical protein
MDPGVLPSWYISTTAFELCHDDTTRESYVAGLFDWWKIQNVRVIFVNFSQIAPDGSNRSGFRQLCSQSSMFWWNIGDLHLIHWFVILSFKSSSPCLLTSFLSGVRSALPMGVAPEAIAEILFGYRLKDINTSCSAHCLSPFSFSFMS